MKKFWVYLSIIFLSCNINSIAQGNTYRFKHLTYSNGLSNSNIYCFSQDDKGFMWIGTEGGLFKYDGFRFKVYKSNINDTTSLNSNAVFSLLKDSQNNFWIGTYQDLMLYNEDKDNFIDLKLSDEYPLDDALDISQILEYPGKGILLASKTGVIFVDNTTFSVDHSFTASLNEAIGRQTVLSLYFTLDGLLWIGTEHGIFSWDWNRQIANHYSLHSLTGIDVSNIIISIYEDSFHDLWVATRRGGVFRKKNGSKNFIAYLKDIDDPKSLGSNECYSFYEDENNKLWIGANGSGINFFNRSDESFSKLSANPDDNFSLLNNNTRSIVKDHQGNLWVCSFQAGIDILINSPYPFSFTSFENTSSAGYESSSVISLFLEDKNTLWAGTDGSGLKRIDRITGKVKTFTQLSDDKSSFPDKVIMNIYRDYLGTFWLGTYVGGLIKFNPKTFEYKQYKNQPNNSESLSHNFVTVVREDSRGNMWIGTNGGGLNLFDTDKETFLTFWAGQANQGDGLVNNHINVIEEDFNGDLWIGTYWGLSRFSIRNFQFKNYRVQSNYANGLSSAIIYCMFNDSQNRLWVGTRKGLVQYDFTSDKFINYAHIEGLASNQINGILEDRKGDLWISTDNGLIRFTPETLEIQHFYEVDGLQGNEFSHNSCHLGFNGEMFFGGYKGFNNFFPDLVRKREYQPEIAFTSLRILDNPIPIGPYKNNRVILERNINLLEQIELKHSDKSIAISFAAIDFIEGHKIVYAYKLDGFDNDWNTADANSPWANYTNLSPGEYTLRVKVSNHENINVKSKEKTIKIKIIPPPWRTWWAYTSYVIVIVLIALNFWMLSIKRIKEKNEIKLEKFKREQTEAISQARMRFFTNISHEIRTPLTLIIGPLEQIISKGKELRQYRKQFDIMLKNARRLLRLINQLLDLRKIELDKTELKTEYADFSRFVKDIVFSFEDFAADRKIDFQFVSNPQKIEIWFDPDKTDKIVFNLLSNAFKYTADKGKITVTLLAEKSLPEKDAKYIELEVADNGKGIRKIDIDKIFNRFYQGEQEDNSQQGWGLGLSLTHSFVKLHNGEIKVESAENVGTKFKVYLPIGDEHLSDSDKRTDMHEPGLNKYIHLSTESYINLKQDADVRVKASLESHLQVLIVEDNIELRDYLTSELSLKYNCYEAADGTSGLEMAIDIMPDLIISDIMMPGMNGVDLCKNLKDNIVTSHIPVILLTAKTAIEDQINGLESGAEAYIPKPFNIEKLIANIESILLNRIKLKEKLGSIEGRIGMRQSSGSEDKFISLIDNEIIDHLSDVQFGVEELAREVGLSRAHLNRKMKAIANIGPNNYIRKIRMEKAAELLLQGELTVSEISMEVGFNSISYFSRIFKSYYNVSPKTFIEKHSGE